MLLTFQVKYNVCIHNNVIFAGRAMTVDSIVRAGRQAAGARFGPCVITFGASPSWMHRDIKCSPENAREDRRWLTVKLSYRGRPWYTHGT